MVYEAADVKGFFEKAKKVIMGLAGKIAGFFKNMFEKIAYTVKQHKGYVKKHKEDIKKGYDLIPADGIAMKRFFKFENISEIQADSNLFNQLDAYAKTHFGLNHVLTGSDDFKSKLDTIKDKETVKNALNTIRANVMIKKGAEGLSASEFKQELTKYLLGTEIKDKLTKTDVKCDEIIKDLENCSQWTKDAKESFKNAKKSLNDIIKKIKEFEKAVNKDDENRESKLAYCKNMINLYKGFIQITTAVKGVQFSLHYKKVNQSLAVSTKLVALVKKPAKANGEEKKEEAQNASFTYQWEDGMNFFTSDLL